MDKCKDCPYWELGEKPSCCDDCESEKPYYRNDENDEKER